MSDNTSRKGQILKDTVNQSRDSRASSTEVWIQETVMKYLKHVPEMSEEDDHLTFHRQVVYGLREAIKDVKATVETILPHIKESNMCTDEVDPGALKTDIQTGSCKSCVDHRALKPCVGPGASKVYVDPVARNTCIGFLKQSLQNVFSSIFYQSETLVNSFDRLNKHIHYNVLDHIRGTDKSMFHSRKSESLTQTILSFMAMGKGNFLDISDIQQEKFEQVESSTQTILSFMAMEKGDFLDISDIKQEKTGQVENPTQTILSLKAMEQGDNLDISDIIQERIEQVVVIRNQLWEQSLQFEEQLKEEKEISAAYETEIRQLNEQLNIVQNKNKKDLQETVDHYTLEISKLNARIKELQNKSQKMREESEKTLQETYRGNETKVSQLNSRIQQLQEESQAQKEKNENLMQQANELFGKITDLKNLLREEGEKNVKAVQEKASKHNSEVCKLNEKIAGLEEQLKLEEKERKQEHKKEIEAIKQSSEIERRKLEEQLNFFHLQARKRPVQLSYLGKGDLMPKVLEELKMSLVDKLGITRHELQFVTCLKGSDVDPDIPLLALCINVSRLGTDASTTMQNIQASNNVLLVILHHKDVHALPSQTSDRVLTGPEFHHLAGIYDIGFLADKGIYSCKMNNTAIDGIVEFITRTHKNEGTLNYNTDK